MVLLLKHVHLQKDVAAVGEFVSFSIHVAGLGKIGGDIQAARERDNRERNTRAMKRYDERCITAKGP
jgi:hypothetical protein